MNVDPHQLRRDLERTKRLAVGLNDELSQATLQRYADELSAELRRSGETPLSPNVQR